MNHYCVKCNHLFNGLLDECPKCGAPRDYYVNLKNELHDEVAKKIWEIRRNAYYEGFHDGVKVGKKKK